MTRALIIEPSGKCYLKELPHSALPDALDARQAIVGGYIEAVSIPPPGDEAWAFMYINEEGKYTIGPEGYNDLATALVRGAISSDDWICGTALIFGEVDSEGHDTDVPEWVVNKYRVD